MNRLNGSIISIIITIVSISAVQTNTVRNLIQKKQVTSERKKTSRERKISKDFSYFRNPEISQKERKIKDLSEKQKKETHISNNPKK